NARLKPSRSATCHENERPRSALTRRFFERCARSAEAFARRHLPRERWSAKASAERAQTSDAAHAALHYRVMAIKDGLLVEFDHEMATTRRLLERVPDDKLSWKPHERSMTLGGLATHLANIPVWGGSILSQTSFDLETAPPNLEAKTSRADVLAHFDQTVRAT